MIKVKKQAATMVAGAILAGGAVVTTTATSANATSCKGVNERKLLSLAGQTDTETYSDKVDSCRASQMVSDFGRAKDAAGLAGMLGAKWWPVGVAAGMGFGWAWNNQEAMKKCEAKHTGVNMTEINGFITKCTPQ